MTAHLLTTELTTLFQESKRKNHDLRNAAEKSLNELKALPQTSEAQLTADLKNRPTFIRPFLIACGSRNVKLAGSAINCLQRLIVNKALPRESLRNVLEGFQECSSLAYEVQLKVLQALPSLLQNYGTTLSGKLLATNFEVCFSLYNSRTAVVSNTAAAVLQQLVTATFDKVSSDDDELNRDELSSEEEHERSITAVDDAYHLLTDLCLMTEGQRPNFLSMGSLPQNYGFELLESVLANHMATVIAHPKMVDAFRLRIMPLTMKILQDKMPFSLTVRIMRILQHVLNEMLFALATECEAALSLLNKLIDSATVQWKRALCLELYQNVYANPALVRRLYATFDEKADKKNIIRDNLAVLVRVAAEKPNLIGLGQESSNVSNVHDDYGEQAALQAGGIVGSIGATSPGPETEGIGISIRWSTLKTSYLDIPDKAEPPSTPATYIYALTLTCVNSISEGLAKFLLPFSTSTEGRSKRRRRTEHGNEPRQENVHGGDDADESKRRRSLRSRKDVINPLSLEDNAMSEQISTSAYMVENCWPALLATYSTFFNATLDTEYYHALIRSFQRFTHVAGVLQYSIPRDAFLTTLGKHSIPASRAVSANIRTSVDLRSRDETTDESDRDSSPAPSLTSIKRQGPIDASSPVMATRHLLCLRAILNLGIALGPSLQQSWSIILETLQQADLLLPRSNPSTANRQPSRQSSQARVTQYDANGTHDDDIGAEVTAAETAATRMIESTRDYSDTAFLDFAKSLWNLLHLLSTADPSSGNTEDLLLPQTVSRKHQRFPSVTETGFSDTYFLQANTFALAKFGDLVQCNVSRIMPSGQPNPSWNFVTERLLQLMTARVEHSALRVNAANVFSELTIAVATCTETETGDQDASRAQALSMVSHAASKLHQDMRMSTKEAQNSDHEIHRMLLEGLRAILEKSGDSLTSGWDAVFHTLKSTFSTIDEGKDKSQVKLANFRARTPNLVRSSFGSLQLICSDYLEFVPLNCIQFLIDTLYLFCNQALELNISLTTTSFSTNVSNFLQRGDHVFNFDRDAGTYQFDNESTHVTTKGSSQNQKSELWLLLLYRLSNVVTDSRLEVRHSALYTLFRIFDDCGGGINPSSWQVCFNIILFPLLDNNNRQYSLSTTAQENSNKIKVAAEWNKTATIIVKGVCSIFSRYLGILKSSLDFQQLWQALLQRLRGLLEREALSASTSVFTGITDVLEEVDNTEAIGHNAVDEAWHVWHTSNPALHMGDSSTKEGNEVALMAYLRCTAQIYRLIDQATRNEYATDAMSELYRSVQHAELPAYSSDVDRATPVQQGVLENLKLIPTNEPPILLQLVQLLAKIVQLPFQKEKPRKGSRSTFVAISKAVINFLSVQIQENATSVSCALVTTGLDALATPIQSKYTPQQQGKPPVLWRAATTAAVEILQKYVPKMREAAEPAQEVQAFWDKVVQIVDGVLAADCRACSDKEAIMDDEKFDIEAFRLIEKLIIPWLGSSHVNDHARRRFAESMFDKSQIHEPHPDDLAGPGQGLLEGLKYDHIGRTVDLKPSLRMDMCYVLLDELFGIVAVHDGSPERVLLAQAAAPYLILRCGLTIKAYVYDQPLRGGLPQPWSEKKELLYILKKMGELEMEPRAFQRSPSAGSKHKKHLYMLYPLLMRALKAASRSQEVTRAISDVLDIVGQDFGF